MKYEKQLAEGSGKYVSVDECVEPGRYKMIVTDNADDDNHKIEFTAEFYISNDRVFLDVTNDSGSPSTSTQPRTTAG